MGKSPIYQRNSNERLTRLFYTLPNGFGYFSCFPKAHSHQTIAVANDYQRAETEASTALYYLGDTIDVYDAIIEVVIVRIDS